MPKRTGVIVVDLQGDFTTLKKGALAVEGTDRDYVEQVRQATGSLRRKGHPIFATQDWHPADHVSFFTSHSGRKPFEVIEAAGKKQVLWPPHCVQETEKAALLLDERLLDAVVKKGQDRRFDSYSGFRDDGGAETELGPRLKQAGVGELVVYGLATDYCVKATALDALKAGYRVRVIEGLSKGVAADTTRAALEEMARQGVVLKNRLDG